MVLVRVRVNRFNAPRRRGKGGLGITILIADHRIIGIQTGFEHLRHTGAGVGNIRAVVPFDGQGVQRGFGAPPGVGHHGHRAVTDAQYLFHAGAFCDGRCIKTFNFATKHRAVLDGCIQHARHGEVGAVNLFAGDFVHRVQTRQPFAHQLPVFRILEGDLRRWRQLGRFGRHLAEGGGSAAGCMCDDAVGSAAFCGRHFPVVGRCLHQHHAGSGAAFAHIVVRFADAAAAAC